MIIWWWWKGQILCFLQLKSCLFRNPLSSLFSFHLKEMLRDFELAPIWNPRCRLCKTGLRVVHRRRGWTVCLSWIEINSRTRADWWDVYRRHFDNKRAILGAATPILPITIRHISQPGCDEKGHCQAGPGREENSQIKESSNREWGRNSCKVRRLKLSNEQSSLHRATPPSLSLIVSDISLLEIL